MYCKKCGSEMKLFYKACPKCGEPTEEKKVVIQDENDFSLVIGIFIIFVLFLAIFPALIVFMPIIALIVSIVGIVISSKKSNQTSLAINGIAAAFSFVVLLLYFIGVLDSIIH